MLLIRTIFLSAFALLCCGCKSNHAGHHSGIGTTYTFISFELITPKGAKFAFTAPEMRALERIWSSSTSGGVTITNHVIGVSPDLAYAFTLSDGYAETSDAYVGTVAGIEYLDLALHGDGGGFTADVYDKLFPLTSILTAARRSEFFNWVDLSRHPNESEKQGESGSGSS